MPNEVRPLPAFYRWLVLVVTSLVCFAQYYIYDSVTPLGTLIKEQLDFSGAQYGLLFTFYSVPNVLLFMVVLAGVLVDRLGIRRSGVLYGLLCFLGAALTALGASSRLPALLGPAHDWLATAFLPDWSPALKIMLLGRMVYGVGAEAILVVNNKVLARWFKGKELAFAFGLNLTLMRLGTYLADNLQAPLRPRFESPETASGFVSSLSRAIAWILLQVQTAVERLSGAQWDIETALWFASALMGVGFLSFFGYIWLDRAARGRLGGPTGADGGAESAERFVLRQAFSFGPSFWYISLLCFSFYSVVFPFHSYAPDIIVQRFGYLPAVAGSFTSFLILGTMVFTPVFGWLVDHKGRRATLMILGCLLLLVSVVVLGYTRLHPVLPMFAVGVALSLVPAALWPAIPLLVKDSRLGTAFGVVGWIQNVGLLAFPWLAGKIADAYTRVTPEGASVVDYSGTLLMFAGLAATGLAFAVLLKWADARRREGPSIESVLLHRPGAGGLE